jgi:uncharacterized protein YcfJ
METRCVVFAMLVMVSVSIQGCSTALVQTAYGVMPQYCTQNNTAAGAIIGSLLGAAVGGAIGGGRGAAIGAASGLALGGATGAQADAQCRQLAYEQAMEMAAQEQAQAAASSSQVSFQSIDYVTPSNGEQHKVTPLNSYTNPATKETCSIISDVSFGPGGGVSNTTQHQVCKETNGQLHET